MQEINWETPFYICISTGTFNEILVLWKIRRVSKRKTLNRNALIKLKFIKTHPKRFTITVTTKINNLPDNFISSLPQFIATSQICTKISYNTFLDINVLKYL